MGSCSFELTIMTTEGVEAAYRQLCAEALIEHGHDPYSGTIATTSGVNLVRDLAPMSLAEAQELASTRIENLRKWEQCEAIPLVHETPATYERIGETTVTVTVSGAVFSDRDKLLSVIAKQVGVKPDCIAGHSLAFGANMRPSISITPKVRATAPEGKPVKRYFIIDPANPRLPTFDEGFETQAAARAALPRYAGYRYQTVTMDQPMEIIAITRREGNEPLVAATVSTKSVTATFHVTTRKKTGSATRGRTRAGWFFYGYAAE